MIDERLVGFDAREWWLDFHENWEPQRRESFLYRLDITKPLSIDSRVWPSVFELDGHVTPNARYGSHTTWAELSSLREALTMRFASAPLKPFRTIAIGLIDTERARRDAVDWSHILMPTVPRERRPEWGFLGFDVGDKWMLSALTNCGFFPELDDIASLRRTWGPLLNDYHLFSDLRAAVAFKEMSDVRLRNDHAPCFVYGLWIVSDSVRPPAMA